MENHNIIQVLSLYIAELLIPVTRHSIAEELHKHPDFPSMLSMSDVLNNWSIPNASYQLTFEELANIPVPFIAFYKNEFVLINQLDEKKIIVSNERWHKHPLKPEEFKKSYQGTILIAERDEASGERNYLKKRRKERINTLRLPFIISGVIVILLAFLFSSPSYTATLNTPIILLTLLKTIGLITSILLLIQSINSNNPLIQKLCGGGKKNNCNAILSSKAAKITEEISWSEVGFFYFAGTWLILLFNSGSSTLIQILALFNLISLPYTFYSIYYQWRIAKKWCLFCCTIQGLLWLEFLSFIPYLTNTIQTPSSFEWINILIGMTMPILTWVFLKPYLLQAQKVQPLKQQLHKFKYNAELFNKILNEETRYALPTKENSIIIGKQDARQIITMVSNPYCPPCSTVHQSLDQWLSDREDIQLQIVFTGNDNKEDPKTKVANHFMALKSQQDNHLLKQALNNWYSQKQKNFETLITEYPIEEQVDNLETLKKQSEWCKMAEITETPTILINGRKLPKPYDIEDIKYFI